MLLFSDFGPHAGIFVIYDQSGYIEIEEGDPLDQHSQRWSKIKLATTPTPKSSS